jgi:hypothetical protein
MPKKSRRTKAKHRARAAKAIQAKHTQQLRAGAVKPQDKMPHEAQTFKPQSPVKTSPKAQDFISRYHYVMPEVKRIGILAGSIIVVLIILSFVL